MVTAGEYIGAIAFARTGDPQFGDFDGAIILGRFGETPNRLPGFLVDDEDVGVRMVNLDHFERTGDPENAGNGRRRLYDLVFAASPSALLQVDILETCDGPLRRAGIPRHFVAHFKADGCSY